MKHAALNVYEIKTSFNEYVIFKRKFNEQSEAIIICTDIDFGMNFMNEFLLLKKLNLYEQLNIVSFIIARDMFNEKIIDKRMHLIIHLINFNVTLQIKLYVIKDIKVDLILDNDVRKLS